MTKAKGQVAPRRAAPKASEFEGTTRVCVRCGEERPLTPENFKPWSKKSAGFRAMCRTCMYALEYRELRARRRGESIVGDEPDHLRPGERGIWSARDVEPRGTVPVKRAWDLTCGQCGETWHMTMTRREAAGLAVKLRVLHARCGRCGGWVGLDVAFTTVREILDAEVEMADTLDGPKDYGQAFVRNVKGAA